MRKFNFKEYRKLRKSNIPYLVRVDPMVVDRRIQDIYLFKASDIQSVIAIKNIFGNIAVTHVQKSDNKLYEMVSGVAYGYNFLIA